MNFTLRQLRYFKALCLHRNFGRAAEACHVSQPALSVQIKALEDIIGGALVERHARDVVVTPLGRQVLAQAGAILDAANGLDRLARDHGDGRRSLSLGLIPTLAPYLLPGTLAELRAGDLQLSVEVREARTGRLLDALRDGSLDAAVLALPTGVDGLIEEELFEDRFLLAGSASRLTQMRSEAQILRPSDLRTHQLLLLEDGHCLTDQALEVCGRERSGAGINMGAGSLGTLSRLVAAGFGLTLMPELAARSECDASRGLAVQRFPEPEPFRRIGLVRRAATDGTGWFADLAAVLRSVGRDIVEEARHENGPATGEPE